MNIRHKLLTTLLSLSDNTDFDVQQDDANFIDDGIEIEPFNLDQEREEGYFDDNGNFVEFARGNDMKVLLVCVHRLGCFVWS
jgi:hypothetical protein